jgi:DNA-binding winged helix-turn-helix (wHTH) protein/tetratricopeptide (TPR) repeat protein
MPGKNAERGRRRWHFAGAVLDERTLELLVNGVDVELERKPLEVLIYLLEHAGEVCTKDELLSGVWPGRILSETVLTKCIGRLREVLEDRDQNIIKTAYGFGYRFIAPLQVELASPASTPEPVRLDFKPGDRPPARPLWSLIERLGIGGHGESWRARHEKTHEQRVFKFALDETSLGVLKREITLFRIINDSLGERVRIVRLLDWNLEQLPYFTEAEYLSGGSLIDWAKARGGITAIPLAERLEVVAKISAALAAVHSVGVLHKNLKPSNIFVDPVAGQPVDIAIGGFGSGGMFDAGHIERLGITRLGFTRTIAAPENYSAASMYLAPEISNDQPFTVKSDIYALGVILYQFVTGDFYKAISPGWEGDIDDELLREDIALLVDENLALRLADAGIPAQRLRALGERRRRLIAQREAQDKAERTRQRLRGARARQVGIALAFAALSVAFAISMGMYFKARGAQEQGAIAAAQAKAVAEFLGDEVFAQISVGAELLTRAGNDIDERFAGRPQVASELHYVMGRAFNRLHEYPLSARQFNRAIELGRQLNGPEAAAALRSASELVEIDYTLGVLRDTMTRYESLLALGERRLAPDDAALLELKARVAHGRYRLGAWLPAAQALENVQQAQRNSPPPPEFIGQTELYLGQVLTDLAKSAEAAVHLRRSVDVLTRAIGPMHSEVAEARAALGRSLADSGQYDDAAAELDQAQALAARLAPPDTGVAMRSQYFRALLFLQQDLPHKAEPILSQIVESQDAHLAAYLPAQGSAPELDHTGPVRQALGEAYAREGRFDDAIATLQRAVAVSERADGAQHPGTLSTRLSLAECLVAEGRDAEARAVLATPIMDLGALPAVHPIVAQLDRVTGLLAQHEGNVAQARKAFGNSLPILQALYGTQHWRVIRARQELQRAAS